MQLALDLFEGPQVRLGVAHRLVILRQVVCSLTDQVAPGQTRPRWVPRRPACSAPSWPAAPHRGGRHRLAGDSSDLPEEYTSAVSKRATPASRHMSTCRVAALMSVEPTLPNLPLGIGCSLETRPGRGS